MSKTPKNSFFKHFLPFCALCVGSFVGLAEFRKLNYTFKRNDETVIFKEYLKQVGMEEGDFQMKSTPSLEEEYENVVKDINIDNWKNIRGPRPWEKSKETQEKLRKEAK